MRGRSWPPRWNGADAIVSCPLCPLASWVLVSGCDGLIRVGSAGCGREGFLPLPVAMAWGVLPPPALQRCADDH